MRLYEIQIDFASPVLLPTNRRDGLSSPASFAADRFFSFISLGWLRLFGEASFRKQIIEPFLGGEYPWLHSDLFPAEAEDLLIPANLFLAESRNLVDCFQQYWLPLSFLINEYPSFANRGIELSNPALRSAAICAQASSKFAHTASISKKRSKDFVSVYSSGQVKSAPADSALRPNSVLSLRGFLKTNESQVHEKLNLVLAFMKDEGAGGMRSSGSGQISGAKIKASAKDYPGSLGAERSSFLILSPCSPSVNMLEEIKHTANGSNRYSVSKNGGWIYDAEGNHTGIKKASSTCFDTASTFAVKPEGRLLDLSRDGHPCYRYAIPFVLAI